MPRSNTPLRAPVLVLVILAVTTGCDRTTPTATQEPVAEALDFTVPALSPEQLESHTFEMLAEEPKADGPALTVIDDTSRPLQQIISPSTRVGYDPGYAWSLGQHYYIGNVASVSTSAHVADGTKHVGSYTAHKQDYTPFLLDFGQRKHIWVQAKVYADHTCGLSVQGNSDHRAWWQFFQGRSASEWGVARRSTQAAPVSQGSCSPSGQTGQGQASETTPSGITCYYFITFDLNSGIILDADFLYCTGSGGVLM